MMNEYMMTILVKVRDCSAGDAVIGLQDLFREQNSFWIIGDPVITIDVISPAPPSRALSALSQEKQTG
jgi:hypothetical protein